MMMNIFFFFFSARIYPLLDVGLFHIFFLLFSGYRLLRNLSSLSLFQSPDSKLVGLFALYLSCYMASPLPLLLFGTFVTPILLLIASFGTRFLKLSQSKILSIAGCVTRRMCKDFCVNAIVSKPYHKQELVVDINCKLFVLD